MSKAHASNGTKFLTRRCGRLRERLNREEWLTFSRRTCFGVFCTLFEVWCRLSYLSGPGGWYAFSLLLSGTSTALSEKGPSVDDGGDGGGGGSWSSLSSLFLRIIFCDLRNLPMPKSFWTPPRSSKRGLCGGLAAIGSRW